MQQQLQAHELAFTFFDALTGERGATPWFTHYAADAYLMHARRLAAPGEIGCYASHIELWRQCAASGRALTVLEDDALLTEEFAAALHTADRLVESCGFIRLEANKTAINPLLPARDQRLAQVNGFELRYIRRIARCTTAYMISPAVARAFIAHSAVLQAPVDRFIQLTWQHRQPLFMLAPAVACQAGLSSDLDRERLTAGARAKNSLPLRLKRGLFKTRNSLQRWHFNHTAGRLACSRVIASITPATTEGSAGYSVRSPATRGNA